MNLLKNIRSRVNIGEAEVVLNAPVSGRIVPLCEVNDETFSEHILGEGFAIVPENGVIVAPADAVIESVPHSLHAVSMTTDSGVELLIHVGLDTVELEGRYFRCPVKVGDRVRAGDVLIEADIDGVTSAGYATVTPVVVTNPDDFASVEVVGEVARTNTPFLKLERKAK